MAAGRLTLAAGVKCTAVIHFRSLGALNYDLSDVDPASPPLLALPEPHSRSESSEKAVRAAGSPLPPPRPLHLPA
eukprot:1762501-Prymnesium_polylepis.1